MAAAEQANQTDRDQIEGDDIVQEFGHDQDQNAGKQGNHRYKRKMKIHSQFFYNGEWQTQPRHAGSCAAEDFTRSQPSYDNLSAAI